MTPVNREIVILTKSIFFSPLSVIPTRQQQGIDLEQLRIILIKKAEDKPPVAIGMGDKSLMFGFPLETKSSLKDFGINLTQGAKDGKLDPMVGRTTKIERVIQILVRRPKI